MEYLKNSINSHAFNRVRSVLASPRFVEGEKYYAATLINRILLVSAVGSALFLLLSWVATESGPLIVWLASVTLLITLGLKFLLHQGYTYLVGGVLSLVVWAVFSVPVFTYDGIRDVAVSGYFIVIAIASLTMGRRILLLFISLTSASIIAAYVAEIQGILVTSFAKKPSPIDLVVVLVTLNTTAWFIALTVRRMVRSEKTLRRERDRAQSYLDIAGVIIVALDTQQTITLINKKGCEVLECGEDNIIGQNWFDIFVPISVRSEISSQYDKLIAGQVDQIGYFENPIRTRSGAQRLIAWQNTIVKDPNGNIIGTLSSGEDITDRRQAEETIRRLAFHDALTELPNRWLFSDRLDQAMFNARRNRHKFALLMIDLDGFKQINDKLGHGMGDEVLKVIAERFTSMVRESDTVARIGGDEFVVILPEVYDVNSVDKVAEKISLGLQQPISLDEHTLTITCSIGAAIYPDNGEDLISLMDIADTAMYRVKQGFRNKNQGFSNWEPPRRANNADHGV